jgi:hypothetical protein
VKAKVPAGECLGAAAALLGGLPSHRDRSSARA